MTSPRFALGADGRVELTLSGVTLGVLEDGAAWPDDHAPRPAWHPLRSIEGRLVSDDSPDDHPWHHGLSIAVPNIDVGDERSAVNTWGGPTFVEGAYHELPNAGRQRIRSQLIDAHRLEQRLEWLAPDGTVVLDELRVTRARVDAASWTLEIASGWRNPGPHSLRLGSPTTAGRPSAGYGGFFLRAAREFDGAAILLDGVAVSAEQAMGAVGSTLALESARGRVTMRAARPTEWFVRVEPTPMLCAAPFFSREVTLDPGAEIEWRWELELA